MQIQIYSRRTISRLQAVLDKVTLPVARSIPNLLIASCALAGCTNCASMLAQSPQSQMPQLVRTEARVQLLVDGSPFLMLGGQAHNSSASNLDDAEKVYESLDVMHANTAEMPISWDLIEPRLGIYDFSLVDALIGRARSHHLRLIFLWFGTAKNATFSYVPDWIKQDRNRYFRARDAEGEEMDAISPFCMAAQEADQRAFSALMKHIRDFDGQDHTVILMQVENETGLIRTDRDYSAAANGRFAEQVPANIIKYLAGHKGSLRPALQQAWEQNGSKQHGTWTETFGDLAPEAFSAWAISSYVDGVAAAGKAEYPIPYYINVALMNTGSARAGEWPSGGATAHVIDIWKANAPHIDIIAPDIYRVDFPEMAAIYNRPDNPLFVPETGFAPYYAPYVFTTLAGYNGLGYSPFGVDDDFGRSSAGSALIDPGTSQGIASRGRASPGATQVHPNAAEAAVEENYRILRPLLPLIASKRYQNSLFPIVLNLYRHEAVAIPLGDSLSAVIHFDEPFVAAMAAHRAGGLIIKLAPDRFVVAGHGFHVNFAELKGVPRNAEYLTIEEGTFDGDRWVRERVLNGDEENVSLPTHMARILMVHLNRNSH